jgi:hypothetical protein
MNLLLKIHKDKLITLGVFLIGLSTFSFYFTDPFYYPVIKYISILIGFIFLILSIKPCKFSVFFLFYCFYLIFYNYSGFVSHFFDQEINSLYLTGLFFIPFFFFLENVGNKAVLFKSLNYIISFFVIINAISFIVFILFTLKVPLPHTNINLGSSGFLYENYSNLLIVCNYITMDYGHFILTRFNGVFQEPGMLGTYIGIILMADFIIFPSKKTRKIILIILGIFTLSLALYIFFFLIFLFRFSFKRLLILLFLSTVFILLLISFLPKNSLDYISVATIDRFEIKNGHLEGDNRRQDQQRFENYLDKVNPVTFLFGNGKGRNQDKEALYSSYSSIIYESGIFGFIIFLLIHFYYLLYIPIKTHQYKYIVLTILPILSIYQGREFIDFFVIIFFVCSEIYFHDKFNMNLRRLNLK